MNPNTYSYKYSGEETIELAGFGSVTSGQVIETDFEVNNPLFEQVNTTGTQTPPRVSVSPNPAQTPDPNPAQVEETAETNEEPDSEKTEGESV